VQDGLTAERGKRLVPCFGIQRWVLPRDTHSTPWRGTDTCAGWPAGRIRLLSQRIHSGELGVD
jgi:hypothetical protein